MVISVSKGFFNDGTDAFEKYSFMPGSEPVGGAP